MYGVLWKWNALETPTLYSRYFNSYKDTAPEVQNIVDFCTARKILFFKLKYYKFPLSTGLETVVRKFKVKVFKAFLIFREALKLKFLERDF